MFPPPSGNRGFLCAQTQYVLITRDWLAQPIAIIRRQPAIEYRFGLLYAQFLERGKRLRTALPGHRL